MDRIDKILRYFDPQRFIEVCEARFDTLRTQVVANLQTKTGSSGKRVNSLGVPEWATGATAASLQTQVEQNDDGFEAAFVGRQGIAGVGGGRSTGDVQAQYASFDAFLLAIERGSTASRRSTPTPWRRTYGARARCSTARAAVRRSCSTCCSRPWTTSTGNSPSSSTAACLRC